jgi:hypothetical protein
MLDPLHMQAIGLAVPGSRIEVHGQIASIVDKRIVLTAITRVKVGQRWWHLR